MHAQPWPISATQTPLASRAACFSGSGPRVTETVAAIVAAHRAGTVSPAQTVARSFQRIRDHNDPAIFISLRDEQGSAGGSRSPDRQRRRQLPLYGIPVAVKDNIDVAGLPHHGRLPGLRLFAGARRHVGGAAARGRRHRHRQDQPRSVRHRPCRRALALWHSAKIRCAAISFRADRVRVRRWRCRLDWCRWRWAPIPQARAACRRCSTTSSG